jgi:hypothetical protein
MARCPHSSKGERSANSKHLPAAESSERKALSLHPLSEVLGAAMRVALQPAYFASVRGDGRRVHPFSMDPKPLDFQVYPNCPALMAAAVPVSLS